MCVMAETHLLKLARFCITLAMSVSVREVRSAGYSCIRLNREGDMMAGHIKRRNREEVMRLSARSSLPRSAHLALHEAKTSFSSRGNMLKPEHYFIAQCQGEQRDKSSPRELCEVRRLKQMENYWIIRSPGMTNMFVKVYWIYFTWCLWFYWLCHQQNLGFT